MNARNDYQRQLKTAKAGLALSLSFLLLLPYPFTIEAAALISDGSDISNLSTDTPELAENEIASGEDSLIDHKAKVFALAGNVEILRSGKTKWTTLKKDAVINEGDEVRVGDNAYAEITYDDYFLNYVRIEENSNMEFRSIEETDIYLSVGKLFNSLDGLVADSEYEVSTPTSVAAVRGTSFVREFDPEALTDETSVVEGTVNVAPIENGFPNFNQAQNVTKDQALHFDREMIQNKSFQKAKPKAMHAEKKKQIQQMKNSGRGRLEQFAGGKKKAAEAQDKFKHIKQDSLKMNRVKNNMGHRNQRQQQQKQSAGQQAKKKAMQHGQNQPNQNNMKNKHHSQNNNRNENKNGNKSPKNQFAGKASHPNKQKQMKQKKNQMQQKQFSQNKAKNQKKQANSTQGRKPSSPAQKQSRAPAKPQR